MGFRRKQKSNKIDLLEISDQERFELIREVQVKLRQRASEAKLWQSFVETEELTINGNVVYESSRPLEGFSSSDMFR